MFAAFNLFRLSDIFRVPQGDEAAATTLIELKTEDGILLVTVDGIYIGVHA